MALKGRHINAITKRHLRANESLVSSHNMSWLEMHFKLSIPSSFHKFSPPCHFHYKHTSLPSLLSRFVKLTLLTIFDGQNLAWSTSYFITAFNHVELKILQVGKSSYNSSKCVLNKTVLHVKFTDFVFQVLSLFGFFGVWVFFLRQNPATSTSQVQAFLLPQPPE